MTEVSFKVSQALCEDGFTVLDYDFVDFLALPTYDLLNRPLETSHSCDTGLAVRHRVNIHHPKLQQVCS